MWGLNWSYHTKLGPSLTFSCILVHTAHAHSIALLPFSSPYIHVVNPAPHKREHVVSVFLYHCLLISPPCNLFLPHFLSMRPSPIYTCLSPNSTWERGADQLGTCPLSMPCKSLSLFLAGKSAHWGISSVTGDWSTLSRWRDLCGISGSSAQLFLQFGQLGCVWELALVGHARHPVPMGGTSIINEKSTYLNFGWKYIKEIPHHPSHLHLSPSQIAFLYR